MTIPRTCMKCGRQKLSFTRRAGARVCIECSHHVRFPRPKPAKQKREDTD